MYREEPNLRERVHGELRDGHEFLGGDESAPIPVELAEPVVQRHDLLLRDLAPKTPEISMSDRRETAAASIVEKHLRIQSKERNISSAKLTGVVAVVLDLLDVVLRQHRRGAPHLASEGFAGAGGDGDPGRPKFGPGWGSSRNRSPIWMFNHDSASTHGARDHDSTSARADEEIEREAERDASS